MYINHICEKKITKSYYLIFFYNYNYTAIMNKYID